MDGQADPGAVILDVIGGLYRGNYDAWIAGAIGTWVTMNATMTGAIFEDNQVGMVSMGFAEAWLMVVLHYMLSLMDYCRPIPKTSELYGV
jgi:hypothetical protein